MASKKAEAALLKQKEAKQKKVLFLLVPVFIALLAWQGPKTFKAITGGDPPPPATAAATPTTTAPTPGSAPSTPGAGAAVPGSLLDTDTPPSALDGQLTNFSVFIGRDPFANAPSGGSSGGTSTDGTDTTQGQTPSSAQLEINSQSEAVSASATFPSSDPVFKLISLTKTSVTIGLASGKDFTNGDPTETIEIGETLTVNGDDGSSFVIKLVSVSSN